MNEPLVRIRARGLADDRPRPRALAPCDLLARSTPAGVEVIAIGPPHVIDDHPAATTAAAIHRPMAVLIPGLVNTHAHLDLTHVGPHPYDPGAGFRGFARTVMTARTNADDPAIQAAVLDGAARSLAGGVVAVGDIAGDARLAAARALQRTRLAGVAFVEVFGIGRSTSQGVARLDDAARAAAAPSQAAVRLGLSPHAPYSCARAVYDHAAALQHAHALPITTHLAETPEEHAFVEHGGGPFADFLTQIGVWCDDLLAQRCAGPTPVQALAPFLLSARAIIAHVNDCSDADLDVLARSGATVAYCPRASEYFRHAETFGPHRYRDMLAAGVRVALGTDSIINLPPEQTARLSTLDDARRLWRRDRTPPAQLLGMATTAGAEALGLDPAAFRFPTGPEPATMAGVNAVEVGDDSADPAAAVLASDAPAEPVLGPGAKAPTNPAAQSP